MAQLCFSQWYVGRQSRNIAEDAFEEAKAKFKADLSKDPRKSGLVQSSNSLEEVQKTLLDAQTRYKSSRKDSKVRKWIGKLSERVQLYGGVLDVFAQHHPEYVALAWGSIKFLLTATLNNEKIVTTLAKAMTRIADMLPRAELKLVLYPTDRMKEALLELSAYILRFFIRARDWYDESMIKSAIGAILRPVELRYNDLLEQIMDTSRTIDELAISGQQAELRDMHLIVQECKQGVNTLDNSVNTVKDMVDTTKRKVDKVITIVTQTEAGLALRSSSMLDTNSRIYDLQFERILGSLVVHLILPDQAYSYHNSQRQQRLRSHAHFSMPTNFWNTPKMQNWSSTQDSALSIISANLQARSVMRDLCVDIVNQLRATNTPYLLAMKTPQVPETFAPVSTSDLLKYLIQQAIKLRRQDQSEKSMALICTSFHEASTNLEWFQLLESILAGISGTVYILVDLDLLIKTPSETDTFSWTTAFSHLFADLKARKSTTKIKVLFVSYGSNPLSLTNEDRLNYVVSAKIEVVTARQRKAGRTPQQHALSFQLKSLRNPQSNHTATSSSI